MSFIFHQNQPFEWPLKVCFPNAGAYGEITITGLFEILDDADFLEAGAEIVTASDAIDHEIEKLMRVFKGWRAGDVLSEDGGALEPNSTNIRALLGQRPFRLAVTTAYSEAITPRTGYRAKN